MKGVPVLGGTAFDRSEPVRVRAHLEGKGETSDVEQPVRLEVKTRRLRKWATPTIRGPCSRATSSRTS